MTIAIGGTATSVTVTNTSGGALTNVPVTFAMPFKAGDLPSGAKFQDMQIDQKATHADGTIRHAVLSYIIPTINAGQTLSVPLVRSSVGVGGSNVTRTTVGFTGTVAVTIAGVTYTADIAAAVASGSAWLTGPICSEWAGQAALMNGATAHTQLHARYEARKYSDGRIRVCVSVEHTWARRSNGAGGYVWNTATPITYNLAITINGSSVYTKTAFVHYPYTRWRKTFWAGAQPAIHIAHDVNYMVATKALPNYDTSVVPATSLINSDAAWVAAHDDGLYGRGMHTYDAMATGGGRSELGILPGWQVTYLLSQDVTAKATMIRASELNGSWAVHFRDQQTGNLISLVSFPYASYHENNLSDNNINPATGQSEMIPFYHGDPLQTDTSHHPDAAFSAYLVTGDYYFMEELVAWGIWPAMNIAAAYRGAGNGIITDPHEIRATAWAMRSFGHSSYLAPDGHAMKTCIEIVRAANIANMEARFLTSNPNNTLGFFWHVNQTGYMRRQTNSYDAASANDTSAVGIAPWMDDYMTGSIGRMLELGFTDANPIFQWKAKFQVKRMTSGAEFCWIMGSWYCYAVRATTGSSTYYTTMAQIWAELPSNVRAVACASAAMATALNNQPTAPVDLRDQTAIAGAMWWSFAGDAEGKPMEMQPALAYCVTHGAVNADNAWLVFDGRAHKPTTQLSTKGAQWAILPREVGPPNITLGGSNCSQTNTSATGALSAVVLQTVSSMRVDTASLISGAVVVGVRGLGRRGEVIPVSSLAYPFLSLPADAGKEVRIQITTPPSQGTFVVDEDTTYTLTGAADGSYPIAFTLYLDGVSQGTKNATLTVGAVGAILNKTLGALTSSAAAKVAVVGSSGSTLGALALTSDVDAIAGCALSSTLGAVTVSAAATAGVSAVTSKSLGSLTSTAAGTNPVVASAPMTLGSLATNSAVGVRVTADASQTLGALQLSSTSSTGNPDRIANLSSTLGALTFSSEVGVAVTMESSITLAGVGLTSATKLATKGLAPLSLGACTLNSSATQNVVGNLTKPLGGVNLVSTGTAIFADEPTVRIYSINAEDRNSPPITPEDRTHG